MLFDRSNQDQNQNQRLYELDDEIPQINHQDLPIQTFITDFLQKLRPVIIKNYAKFWPAFTKWQNTDYLIEQAGDEVIYTERAPLNSNEFAYFKKSFKKQYMSYRDFVNVMNDPNRQYNYYFAQEKVPTPLQNDTIQPHYVQDYLHQTDQAFWHGIGTVTLPHTDGDENFMCVFKGYKNFTIVSPYHSKFVYPGQSQTTDIMPINYSPVNFDYPDLVKFPLFKQAKVYKIHLQAGDCLYLPGHWWHQVTSSPTECIAVSTWYHPNNYITEVFFQGVENTD